ELALSLTPVRPGTFRGELSLHLLHDRLDLALVASRADHEVVRDPDQRPHVEHHYVLPQLRGSRPGRGQRLFHGITQELRLTSPLSQSPFRVSPSHRRLPACSQIPLFCPLPASSGCRPPPAGRLRSQSKRRS